MLMKKKKTLITLFGKPPNHSYLGSNTELAALKLAQKVEEQKSTVHPCIADCLEDKRTKARQPD